MKFIHVINLGKMGGAENIFIQYIKNSKNIDNVIFCISNSIAEEISNELIHFPIVHVNRLSKALPIKLPSFLRATGLTHKIKKERADAVIFWDFIPKLQGKIKNIKSIYYDHGSSWRFSDSAKTRVFFQSLDAGIVASKASKRIIEERFNAQFPIKIINNSLPNSQLVDSKKNAPDINDVVLGTASRLVSLKGIGVSIMAVAELKKRGYSAKLYIAGKGPNEKALRNLVEKLELNNDIIFLGFQSDLTDFYNKIHFYMSTSITENFSLSCLDALRHKIPCIYSLTDGQPEVIENGITGVGIIPKLLPEEYLEQSGYSVEKPYFSYDPLQDKLVAPKMVSYIDCADVIDHIISKNSYNNYIENIEKQLKNIKNNPEITELINGFLKKVVLEDE